ncbi:MAG: hypothetical protein PVI43_01550 [Candidatus Bathyarchaeota archaeon]|jgi:hypothetical protein
MRDLTLKQRLFSIYGILVLFFIIALTAGGCALFQRAHLPEGFCDNAGDRADSWLLKVSDRLAGGSDWTAEDKLATAYWSMVRVSALLALPEENWLFMRDWHKNIGDYYSEHAPDITYLELIDEMFSTEKYSPRQIALIKTIVIPDVDMFRVLLSIVPWDDCALKSGWARIGKLLQFETPAAAQKFLKSTSYLHQYTTRKLLAGL